MKKLLAAICVIVFGVILFVPTQESEAQVLLTRKCCDGDGVVRCTLVNWTPVGDPCYCYYQGWGIAC